MWTSMASDTRPIGRRAFAALPAFMLLALALVPSAVSSQGAAAAQGDADLRRVIEQRYEVLPIRDGVLLKPRVERLGVRSIELAGETLAVNGERLAPEVLRAWLAEEAEPVLRLHRLPPGQRRALFDLVAEAGAAVPATGTDTETSAEAPGIPAEVPPGEEGEEFEIGAPPIPPIPPAPPLPDDPDLPRRRSGSRVSITQDVVVERGEVATEAVAVLGSVRVDGEVRGDVVAVGGSVTINGRVDGEVVAVGSGVRLGPGAEVMRDVTSVGGRVQQAPGSRVHGAVNEVSMWRGGRRAWTDERGWDFDVDHGYGDNDVADFMFWVVWAVFLALLSVIALLVARGAVERVERQVALDPWRALAVGFLVEVLFVPMLFVVTIVLLISVIGWPLFLLYPFAAMGLLVAFFLGYVGVALRFGRWLEGRFGRTFVSPYFAVVAGVVTIQLFWTLGHLLQIPGRFLGPVAGMTLAFGALFQFLVWTMGLGASLLAWSERRRERSLPRMPAPPAPPPPPVAPEPERQALPETAPE